MVCDAALDNHHDPTLRRVGATTARVGRYYSHRMWKRVTVTGGAGRLRNALTRARIPRAERVRVLDVDPSPRPLEESLRDAFYEAEGRLNGRNRRGA